jgi:diacylglycerol O-acyltransferase / wax synthase
VSARRMSAQDALWLTMDRPNNLMVIDVAVVLAGMPSSEDVYAGFQTLVDRYPVFGRRAQRAGNTWLWVDDPDFDLERHVSEIRLDSPLDMSGVQRHVAEMRSQPMDRDHPLWMTTVIGPVLLPDGLEGSVVVTRFHHAIADGVRLTQVMLGMLDPLASGVVPAVSRRGISGGVFLSFDTVRSATGEAVRVVGNTGRAVVGGAGHAITHPRGLASAAMGAVTSMLDSIRHPDRFVDAFEALGGDDHRSVNDMTSVGKLVLGGSDRTVWTGQPGSDKAVAWSEPMPLAWVKQAAREHGATVNDILVGALAGALRSYLAGRGDEVDEVIWMVPVNLKPFDDELPEDLGNYFALVMLDMPLDGETPAERIAEMHHRMQRIKNSDEPILTFGLQRAISMTPQALATFATNFFANKAVGVLTNVPGPTIELGFAGVPVRQVIGFAPCSGDQPLTATIFTYNGTVTVGFASDAGLVPDPQTLVALMREEIEALRSPLG